MNRNDLIQQIKKKQSVLCVGLDSDIYKIPPHLSLHYNEPLVPFNQGIIETTKNYTVAYKFNIAFYESLGPRGWDILAKTLEFVPKDCFKIADAKRGDIGNTSEMYARTFFETYNFDAITVAPYMGVDSLDPFFAYENKWVIVLALTSNPGSNDFQMRTLENGNRLYEEVLIKFSRKGSEQNTMFVIGATNDSYIDRVRRIVPNHFLLMPGIGAQGGDLNTVLDKAINTDAGVLINSSRGVIYSDSSKDYALKAGESAHDLQRVMKSYIPGK